VGHTITAAILASTRRRPSRTYAEIADAVPAAGKRMREPSGDPGSVRLVDTGILGFAQELGKNLTICLRQLRWTPISAFK
jgi:hypothetical protein